MPPRPCRQCAAERSTTASKPPRHNPERSYEGRNGHTDRDGFAISVSIFVSVRSLNDQLAVEHVHAAGERELAGFIGDEIDRRRLERGKIAGDPEVVNYHLLAAGRGFVAEEIQTDRPIFFHHYNVGGITAFDHDIYLLNPGFIDLRGDPV